MKNVGSSKKIFSFNAVTAKECIERFKNVFDKYCVASDIELIHYSSGHISAVAPPLKYPVIIETKIIVSAYMPLKKFLLKIFRLYFYTVNTAIINKRLRI